MRHDKKANIFSSPEKKFRLSRLLLNLIFIPALLIIFLISVLSHYQVNVLIGAYAWEARTYEVIQAIDSALYAMVDIETHQRAYLITNNNQFITDIDSKKSDLQKTSEELKNLTRDNPQQNVRALKFITLLKQRIDMLTQVTQIKASHQLDSVTGMDLFHQGQNLSDRLNDLGQQIKAIELVLLNARTAAALDRASKVNFILSSGDAISIIILILAFVLINNELSIRIKNEQGRKNAEARLFSIIENASDMIAALDLHYKYLIFNEAYEKEFKRIFGKSIAIGMSLEDILADSPEAKNKLLSSWKSSIEGMETTRNIEFDVDNEKNVYEVTSSLIKDENNLTSGAVHIIRNITKRAQEQLKLHNSYKELNQGMRELQHKNDQITLLVEMSDILLACSSQEELSNVIVKYCQRILQFAHGSLYLMHPSKNYLEIKVNWGTPTHQEKIIMPDQCWAIRRGRIHFVGCKHEELICDHVKNLQSNSAFFCVPLMAQNDIYGLLYLESSQDDANFSENQRLLINAFTELTALALANVRLRENLRYQSIRDPLTGLYNRRYLEDFLFKQINQAENPKTPIAILMLDLDHFKKINDTYGHDVGDMALKELSNVLQKDIRVSDLASRYGGEEFILIFYNTTAEVAKNRATEISRAIAMTQIKYGTQQVSPITISIGIAEYPQDGQKPGELIEAADKALYFAKNNGRNKIVLFSEIPKNNSRP